MAARGENRQAVRVLLLLFLVTIGVDWPALPNNARLADLVFLPLAVLALTLPRTRWTWQWSELAIAAYLVGSLPAIAVSPDQRHSALEMVRQLYLVAIYVVFAIVARQGFARTVATGLALGGAVLSITGLIFVVLQWTGEVPPAPLMGEFMPLPYLGDTLRLRAMTASEAMFACLLTAAAPLAITLCMSDRVRMWCAAAVAMIAAAGFTFSHAIAGVAVAALMAAWPSAAAWPRARRLAIAGVVVVVLGLNFAATVSLKSVTYQDARYGDTTPFHHAVDEGETRIGGATISYSVMSYARIKQVAWQTFLEHPIAGLGLDNFHAATRRAQAAGWLPSIYRDIDPHSTLLGRLAECGIIGGVTLLLLWIAWAGMARDVSGSPLGLAAAAALAGILVNSINADVMNFRFLWVLMGLVRGLDVRSRDTQTSN
jgi:hypothetical protein